MNIAQTIKNAGKQGAHNPFGANMNNKPDGGPAFPAQFFDERATGMSLRDAMAIGSLHFIAICPWPDMDFKPVNGLSTMENNAVFAYQMADAMLKARQS